jgi:hypothetical protein
MGWQKRYHKRYLDYLESGKDYRFENKYDDPRFKKSNEGMIKFSRLINTIDGKEFSEYQLDLLQTMFPFVTKIMFDEHWTDYKSSIMKLYQITKADIEAHRIISATARREGKTTFYISFAIAGMLSVPTDHGLEFKISFPAHEQKTSRDTLALLKYRMRTLDEYATLTIEEDNADVFRFSRGDAAGYVEGHAWPGGSVSINHTFWLNRLNHKVIISLYRAASIVSIEMGSNFTNKSNMFCHVISPFFGESLTTRICLRFPESR